MGHQLRSDATPTLIDTAIGPIAITRAVEGGTRPVICVHGVPGSASHFRYLTPHLESAFDVICPDMPGFGDSPIGTVRSVGGWARVLRVVADSLELERPIVLGYSFGCAAALDAVARWPERFSGLILLASPGGRRHRAYLFPPWVMRALAVPTGISFFSGPLSEFARRTYKLFGMTAPGDNRLVHNQIAVVSTLDFRRVAEQARACKIPVLLVHCADDRVIQVSIARGLAKLIADCEPLFYDKGGHILQKTRAEDIARAVVEKFG